MPPSSPSRRRRSSTPSARRRRSSTTPPSSSARRRRSSTLNVQKTVLSRTVLNSTVSVPLSKVVLGTRFEVRCGQTYDPPSHPRVSGGNRPRLLGRRKPVRQVKSNTVIAQERVSWPGKLNQTVSARTRTVFRSHLANGHRTCFPKPPCQGHRDCTIKDCTITLA